MNNLDKESAILVTGASGYIASHIIHQLLSDGYKVHGTVRDKNNKEKTAHLYKMDTELSGSLTLFNADLLQKNSFDEAIKGCELVIHTASPFLVDGIKDAQKQLIEPAKEGTRNVLESATRAGSIKRVVLTSSCASIYGDNIDMANVGLTEYTEKDWNTSSTLSHNPYSYSKTIAEKEAWEMAEEQTVWTLTTINPGFVLGPSFTKREDSASIKTMIRMGSGEFKMGVPDFQYAIVDVRDVAKAHVLAALSPTASGRHIAISDHKTILELGLMLRSFFGKKFPFPKGLLPYFLVWLVGPLQGFTRKYIKNNWGYKVLFNTSYIKKDLGLTFRPIEDTVKDHFQQLLDDGLVKSK